MIKFKQWHFVYIGQHIANRQDKGVSISADELEELTENRKLLPWIELNICSLDFWDNDAKKVMEEEFWSIASCDDFDIEHDGLARLTAYCFAFIENLPTRTIEDLL